MELSPYNKECYSNILYSKDAKKVSDVRENVSFLAIDIAGNRLVNKKTSKLEKSQ